MVFNPVLRSTIVLIINAKPFLGPDRAERLEKHFDPTIS